MSKIHKTSGSPLLKKCNKCGCEKSEDDFQNLGPSTYEHKVGAYKPKVENYKRQICNTCRNLQKRSNGLKKLYGIDLDEYNNLLEHQNGVCAICQDKCPTGRNLAVDHSHKTGKVRGLLCVRCNQGLGHFMDREDLITRMLEYARKHRDE